jgi:hypothetical protein
MNRLSAEWWERVEKEALRRSLMRVARLRDQLTEGGRMYGETPLSPEMAESMVRTQMNAPMGGI